MKKAIFIIACFAVLLVFGSAYTNRNVAPQSGYKSPSLVIDADNASFSLGELKGDYVLLTFWSSSDARSRILYNDYTSVIGNAGDKGAIEMVSVNFDRSENLFREVVAHDNLTAGKQFHVTGQQAARIMDDFALNKGLKTFLLDKNHRIIAVDPGIDELTKILKS